MMLNGLQYAFQLWRLQADIRRIARSHKKRYDQAKQEKKSRGELAEIDYEERMDREYVDDQIWRLQMQYITQEAEKYLVPIPEFDPDNPDWSKSTVTGHFLLSLGALANLRVDIRQERKAGLEYWATWITLSTGLVGALIGLVALLKS